MAENFVSKLTINGVTYEIKDAEARKIHSFSYTVSTDAATTPQGVKWMDGSTEITGTLAPAEATMYIIYFVPSENGPSDGYDEYITVKDGSTYSWEKLGNTDIDLSDYSKNNHYHNLTPATAMAYGDITYDKASGASASITGTPTTISVTGTPEGSVSVDWQGKAKNFEATDSFNSLSNVSISNISITGGQTVDTVPVTMSTASSAAGTYTSAANIGFISNTGTASVVGEVTSTSGQVVGEVTSTPSTVYTVPSNLGSASVWSGASLDTTGVSVVTNATTGASGSGATWAADPNDAENLVFTDPTWNQVVASATVNSNFSVATGVSPTTTVDVAAAFTPSAATVVSAVGSTPATVVSSVGSTPATVVGGATTSYLVTTATANMKALNLEGSISNQSMTFDSKTITATGSYTPEATVASASFTGTALQATSSYTPAGSVTLTSADFTYTTANAGGVSSVSVAASGSTGTAINP